MAIEREELRVRLYGALKHEVMEQLCGHSSHPKRDPTNPDNLNLASHRCSASASTSSSTLTSPTSHPREYIMASESRLYIFSDSTKAQLRKFRLGTSRSKEPQAVIYQIDKRTLEISPTTSASGEEAEVHTTLASIADSLPDNSPRFVLLSYPLTLPDGRQAVPYVMLSYIPATCPSEMRMVYAGAKELLRNQAEVGRVLEVDDAEEVEGIEERLRGEE